MLKIYNLNESNEWDSIVRSFKNYDVYYLSGYAKGLKVHGDGTPILIYYQDEICRGINVVMKRDISEINFFKDKIKGNTYFDFATPYGYGGWLIEGHNTENLFKEYKKWCNNNSIISEFVRFHPVLNNFKYSENNYEIVSLGETVSIDITNKEMIWNNFNPKNRNVIRKALNNGIIIKNGMTKELFETFKEIYNATMDKDNADKYYYFKDDFYESIRNDLKDNATIFYAELGEKIIAASIILYANDKLNYHLSGSLRAYQNLAPSNLMLWKAAEWGYEKGYKSFHLGGGVGSKDDSLLRFKKSFYRGELCRYHIGKKIFNEGKYDELVQIRDLKYETSFFPKYRNT